MSTYNGEKYIKEQLESIIAQKGVKISLLVRDDGSSDRTAAILKRYSQEHENISYYTGNNLGASKSFFDLLKKADHSADYFAFSDQDDYWLPDKLIRAVKMLRQIKQQDIPLLYGSMVTYASEDLQNGQAVSYRNRRKTGLGNALVENIFMGCTEVFNRSLLELVSSHQPKGEGWHDWWLYLTASAFGKAVYDRNAYILYRQHGGNRLGMQKSWSQRWRNRFSHFQQLRHSLNRQAVQFLKAFDAKYPDKDLVWLLAHYRESPGLRLRLIAEKRIYRQQKMDDLTYRLLFLLGLL
ncbi:MAG: glycosyltransferase family 2 protein [Eubacterium sp.]|nr:glycosyltransferase family 2 protein [Eubacterium sp.]